MLKLALVVSGKLQRNVQQIKFGRHPNHMTTGIIGLQIPPADAGRFQIQLCLEFVTA